MSQSGWHSKEARVRVTQSKWHSRWKIRISKSHCGREAQRPRRDTAAEMHRGGEESQRPRGTAAGRHSGDG